MKKLILTTGLVAIVAASSFGQGQIAFKTTGKNDVYSATDGTTASLALVPTTGVVGSFGTVSYEILTAPSTTALLTSESQFLSGTSIVTPNGWAVTAVGPVSYGSPGAITSVAVTLPASAGSAGTAVDMEIIAFTGSANNVTMFGYSGQGAFGIDTTPGVISWNQSTGNPPLTIASAVATGTSGLGSMILEQVPEPSTIALGGLAASADRKSVV